jgi:hypothetical protein
VGMSHLFKGRTVLKVNRRLWPTFADFPADARRVYGLESLHGLCSPILDSLQDGVGVVHDR